MIEERQGTRIGCIEEVAWYMGFIDTTQLLQLAEAYDTSGYGEYLRQVADWPRVDSELIGEDRSPDTG